MTAQLYLFAARPASKKSPFVVKVHLHEPCSKCGCKIGVIGHGCGPHPAELRCSRRIKHQRWLSERERQIAIRVASSPQAPDVILLWPRGRK